MPVIDCPELTPVIVPASNTDPVVVSSAPSALPSPPLMKTVPSGPKSPPCLVPLTNDAKIVVKGAPAGMGKDTNFAGDSA